MPDVMLPVIESPDDRALLPREGDGDGVACSSGPGQRTLLAVTFHFPPSAASGTHRMLGFARNLPQFSWDVSVVAPPLMPWEPIDQALCAEVPDSTRVFN